MQRSRQPQNVQATASTTGTSDEALQTFHPELGNTEVSTRRDHWPRMYEVQLARYRGPGIVTEDRAWVPYDQTDEPKLESVMSDGEADLFVKWLASTQPNELTFASIFSNIWDRPR